MRARCVYIADGSRTTWRCWKAGSRHTGRIVLNHVELAQAIAEFNRYNPLPLQLGNPSFATRRITRVFRSGETDAFLEALEEAFGVHAERTSTAIVLK